MIGILGLLGYILENPVYYVFFTFFILFLIPVYNKKRNHNVKEESNKFEEETSPSIIMGNG